MLNDLLKRIADAGRQLRGTTETRPPELIELCEAVLRGKGEATGIASAIDVLDGYRTLPPAGKLKFFEQLLARFSGDPKQIQKALERFAKDPARAARELHFASEPPTQELARRLNRAPGGTAALVAMRRDLLEAAATHPELLDLDRDFKHLLGSWFNRGFLELRRIDWGTAAETLEHIIAYEAVHEITSWDDLRGRVGTPDRRLYGFFHPAIQNEPLIFVEVALTMELPDSIDAILAPERKPVDPQSAKTAVFYSISNCHTGLRGISFGNFLIKQVVEDLRSELRGLRTFVTLSPVPGLRRWAVQQLEQKNKEKVAEAPGNVAMPATQTVANTTSAPAVAGPKPASANGSAANGDKAAPAKSGSLTAEQLALIEALQAGADPADPKHRQLLSQIAARYLTQPSARGGATDPVARFHLGNGARLERIHTAADSSARGQQNSWGVMVNYLYALEDIERNHEAYASSGEIVCSSAVRRLARD